MDTVTVAFDFQDENNNGECTRVMKRLIQLAQRLNAVVVFLHHIGKAKQEEGQTPHNVHRSRGGSALSGASTAIINLLPDPKADDVVTLECAKVKGEKFADCLLKLNKQTRWFEGPGSGADDEAAPVPLYDQILNSFNGHALKRADVMAQFPKLSEDTIRGCVQLPVTRRNSPSKRKEPGCVPGFRVCASSFLFPDCLLPDQFQCA